MNLLAVDTARRHGSLALLRDGRVAATASLGVAPGFSEVLFDAVLGLLRAESLEVSGIDGFAAATGPGSFTGIRVGVVAMKALAEAGGKPLVGISSLRALAAAADCRGPRAALLDARRGQLFGGWFGPEAEALGPEVVGSWDELWPRLEAFGGPIVVNDGALFAPGGAADGAPEERRLAGPRQLAASVAGVAAADIARGLGRRPEEVEANYIRRAGARLPAVTR